MTAFLILHGMTKRIGRTNYLMLLKVMKVIVGILNN